MAQRVVGERKEAGRGKGGGASTSQFLLSVGYGTGEQLVDAVRGAHHHTRTEYFCSPS